MSIGSTLRTLVTALLLASVAGCASFATQRMADNLASAMLNQDDPDTVRAGAPAYLLLLDSLIEASPDDTDMLIAGANLYGAYASGLIEDPVRGKRLSSRALNYARKALCGKEPRFCSLEHAPFDDFIPAVNTLDPDHIKSIYAYASSWAGWIRAHSDDWNAIADLPRVEMLLQWWWIVIPPMPKGVPSSISVSCILSFPHNWVASRKPDVSILNKLLSTPAAEI